MADGEGQVLSLDLKFNKIISTIFISIIFLIIFGFNTIPKAKADSECSDIKNKTGINNLNYHYTDSDKKNIFTSISLKTGNTESTTWSYDQDLTNVKYFEAGLPKTGTSDLKLYKNTLGSLTNTYILVSNDQVLGTYRFFNFENDDSVLYKLIKQNKPSYLVKLDWSEYYIDDGQAKISNMLLNVLDTESYYNYAAFQQCRGTTPIQSYQALHDINLAGNVDYTTENPTVDLQWTYSAHVTNTQYIVMRKEDNGSYTQLSGKTRIVIDPYTGIANMHYTDDTVQKGKTYTYQIQPSHTSQYKSNEVTLTIKSETSNTDKECSAMVNEYKTKIAKIRLLNSQIAGGDSSKTSELKKELEELKKLEKDINNKCNKEDQSVIEGINNQNQQIINNSNTNVVTEKTPTSRCTETYCQGEKAKFPYKYMCEGICWINEGIMNIVNWAFEYLRGAISTESKNPITPSPNKYLNGSSSSSTTSSNTSSTSTTNTGSINAINSGASIGNTSSNNATNNSINSGASAGIINTNSNASGTSINAGIDAGTIEPIQPVEVQ